MDIRFNRVSGLAARRPRYLLYLSGILIQYVHQVRVSYKSILFSLFCLFTSAFPIPRSLVPIPFQIQYSRSVVDVYLNYNL